METQKLTHTHIHTYMVMCWKQRNENYVYLNDFYLPFNMKEKQAILMFFQNISLFFLPSPFMCVFDASV